MPSVAMKAFTRSLVMMRPLARPMPAPINSTIAIAPTTEPPSISFAVTSEASEIRAATDRSSEPSRITIVWPSETMPSATERCSMLTMLPVVRKSPPWIVTTIQARMMMPMSAPYTGAAGDASRPTRQSATRSLRPAARVPAVCGGSTTLMPPPPRATRSRIP